VSVRLVRLICWTHVDAEGIFQLEYNSWGSINIFGGSKLCLALQLLWLGLYHIPGKISSVCTKPSHLVLKIIVKHYSQWKILKVLAVALLWNFQVLLLFFTVHTQQEVYLSDVYLVNVTSNW